MGSPVAAAWEKLDYLVTAAQKGSLVVYTKKDAPFTRRDVVNNADVLGPLIEHLGSSALLDWTSKSPWTQYEPAVQEIANCARSPYQQIPTN